MWRVALWQLSVFEMYTLFFCVFPTFTYAFITIKDYEILFNIIKIRSFRQRP